MNARQVIQELETEMRVGSEAGIRAGVNSSLPVLLLVEGKMYRIQQVSRVSIPELEQSALLPDLKGPAILLSAGQEVL
jgi:hypothetical protein